MSYTKSKGMTRVLIIDSDAVFRSGIGEVLTLAGYQVVEAGCGKQGAALGLRKNPDLILCDFQLTDFDGFGLLHLFNNNENTRAIPFIFTSFSRNVDDIRRAMDLGADDYLIKPLSDTEILSAIDARLRKKQFCKEQFVRMNDEQNVHSGNTARFDSLLDERKTRTFRRGQTLFYEGDPCNVVWVLLQGTVKTVKIADDGRELITAMFHQDDLIGINGLFSEECYNESAIAVTDARLTNIPRSQFENYVFRYPDVAQKTILMLSRQVRQQEEQLMQIAYQSVRKRISEAILRLCRSNGGPNIHITRVDLAALSGTAPETVSRILSDFRSEGLIHRQGNELTVLGMKKLERVRN